MGQLDCSFRVNKGQWIVSTSNISDLILSQFSLHFALINHELKIEKKVIASMLTTPIYAFKPQDDYVCIWFWFIFITEHSR